MPDSGPEAAGENTERLKSRLWRYGPVICWMVAIFFASTDEFSSAKTASILEPFLRWCFPHISRAHVELCHLLVRKAGHLSEYAILGLLLARAFSASGHLFLRRRWFAVSLSLITVYALSDEYHQSFVPSRTASIYDSLIDIAGGLMALGLIALWRTKGQRRRKGMATADPTLSRIKS